MSHPRIRKCFWNSVELDIFETVVEEKGISSTLRVLLAVACTNPKKIEFASRTATLSSTVLHCRSVISFSFSRTFWYHLCKSIYFLKSITFSQVEGLFLRHFLTIDWHDCFKNSSLFNLTNVTGHDEGRSGSSTLTPLFKGAIVCVEGLADLFFGQWEADLKVEYGFCPITIKFSAQLLVAFLLHPDKIIDAWVRDLDFRLVVCQSKKIHVLLWIFNKNYDCTLNSKLLVFDRFICDR